MRSSDTRVQRLSGLVVVLAMVAWTGLCGGCVARLAGEPDRLEHFATYRVPPEDWPARDTAKLDEIVRETPRQITNLVLDGTVPRDEISPDLVRAAERPQARITYNKRFGVGIIRAIRFRDQRPTLRFVSYSKLDDRPSDQRAPRFLERTRRWLERYLKENVPGVKPTDEKTLSLVYEGTQLRLREPEHRRPIGLVVHMAGLGSMEYEQPVIDELLARGWAVLRIATPSVWWYESKPVVIKSADEIEPTAQRLARTLDDLVAEPAYAAEAALEYLAERRPDIPQKPLVMFGCSAGSLASPAVIARMPDKFSAAVLVGSGANLLKLSQMSDLTDGGIRLMWADGVGNASERARLYDTYLMDSHLDPYQTARTMTDKPVLMVQAALDSTVSASLGDLLWERLERPERWVFTGGHRLLFWRLGDQAKAIADWIDKATEPLSDPSLVRGPSAGRPVETGDPLPASRAPAQP